MPRRIAIAAIAPDITLPIWAAMFRRAVLPTVDEVRVVAGSPIAEMRTLADRELGFARIRLLDCYPSHGHELTELCRSIEGDADVLVIESDCFVRCAPSVIREIWDRLHLFGVMGSRMARGPAEGAAFLDTFGAGLYPNMCFASLDVLRKHTSMDWTSRDGGDVGQIVGEELHEAGLHNTSAAHLPQCRLSSYCGVQMVEPGSFKGPWLHVGEMSGIPRWGIGSPPTQRHTHSPAAVAAYAAAIESGLCRPGAELERMRGHVEWFGSQPAAQEPHYQACKRLLGRVFNEANKERL